MQLAPAWVVIFGVALGLSCVRARPLANAESRPASPGSPSSSPSATAPPGPPSEPRVASVSTEGHRCRGLVSIPDASLRARLVKALKLEGALTAERATTVTELDLRNAGATSLEGMQCFAQLERLDLGSNKVRDLAPLAGLSRLVELKVTHNQLADLGSLPALPSLEKLALDGNKIRDLSPLARIVKLRELSISENAVRDLSPLTGLTGLEKLQAPGNRIVDLTPLGALTHLQTLSAGSNCVSDLKPVAGLPKLSQLSIPFNYVTSIEPLAAMTQLRHLGLSGNYFAGDLKPLANLYELYSLSIDSTGQKDVGALTELWRYDFLLIERNPIDCDRQAKNIAVLEEHAQLQGGRVAHDCTDVERRARRQGLRDPSGLSTPVVRNKARDERCKPD
jgi:hypothetical protein